LDKELAELRKRRTDASMDAYKAEYGVFYRKLVSRIKSTIQSLLPSSDDALTLAGFVWFQGYNDQFSDHAKNSYEENLIHFIHDLRRDLDSPKLPFVIGTMGIWGKKAKSNRIADAQRAVPKHGPFVGNVVAVDTAEFWDEQAEKAYKTWRQDFENWSRWGSDRPYHYLGSPLFFSKAGVAFADALVSLISQGG